MPALITDWTDPGFDAYASLAEVLDLIRGLDGLYDIKPWQETTQDAKENLIRFSTRELADLTFVGTLVDTITGPIAQWPRSGITAPNGTAVADDAIPAFIKQWVAERQLELLNFRPGLLASFEGGTVKSEEFEGIGRVEYFDGTTPRGEIPLSTMPSYDNIAWVVGLANQQPSAYVAALRRY